MTPEISMGLKHDRKSGCSLFEGQWRISGATRYMFGSMSPFTAIFIEFVMLWVAIMIGWQLFGRDLPFQNTATWVMVLGALMQGFGSVAMIGCEIRTYMRLGLGYATAVAAFPGFLLGYLPYTLFAEWWENLSEATVITHVTSVPELFSQDPATQFLVAMAYGAVLVLLIIWSVRRGMRLTGTTFKALATTPNDELSIEFFKRNFPEDQGSYSEELVMASTAMPPDSPNLGTARMQPTDCMLDTLRIWPSRFRMHQHVIIPPTIADQARGRCTAHRCKPSVAPDTASAQPADPGRPRITPVWLALLVLVLITGCAAAPERLEPLPAALVANARLPGIAGGRYWGDERPAELEAWLALPEAALRERYGGIMGRRHNYLVISGGGGDGAFGAGLLTGWTETGTRPEFQIVTGISTGALIAPFAFLGSDYDPVLREVYTEFSTEDLTEPRGPLEIIRGDSVTSTRPLRRKIAAYLNEEVLAKIAAEGRKGRSLLVGTTHLDAGRPVVWDITRLAASKAPNAPALIHDVILASASIPGVFPPVLLEVEANGRRYDELHVDGGVTAQLFFSPAGADWRRIAERLDAQGAPRLYVIRNAKLRPHWQTVKPKLLPIMSRSIDTLIGSQSIGNLAELYIVAREQGLDYRLAYIPQSFYAVSKEPFDKAYMNRLFQLGRQRALAGDPWLVPGDLD
ncbi:MAG: patatin-like phospholipase family protein [Halochromatium sp.]